MGISLNFIKRSWMLNSYCIIWCVWFVLFEWNTMESPNMKLIVTELILLILSNVLQIVSLAAPGWFIRVQTYLWKRDGIFYTESCSRNDEDEKWDCEKKSWLDVYHDDLENVRLNKTFFYSGHNVAVAYAGKIIRILNGCECVLKIPSRW